MDMGEIFSAIKKENSFSAGRALLMDCARKCACLRKILRKETEKYLFFYYFSVGDSSSSDQKISVVINRSSFIDYFCPFNPPRTFSLTLLRFGLRNICYSQLYKYRAITIFSFRIRSYILLGDTMSGAGSVVNTGNKPMILE